MVTADYSLKTGYCQHLASDRPTSTTLFEGWGGSDGESWDKGGSLRRTKKEDHAIANVELALDQGRTRIETDFRPDGTINQRLLIPISEAPGIINIAGAAEFFDFAEKYIVPLFENPKNAALSARVISGPNGEILEKILASEVRHFRIQSTTPLGVRTPVKTRLLWKPPDELWYGTRYKGTEDFGPLLGPRNTEGMFLLSAINADERERIFEYAKKAADLARASKTTENPYLSRRRGF